MREYDIHESIDALPPRAQYTAAARDFESACAICRSLNGQPFDSVEHAEEMLSFCEAGSACCTIDAGSGERRLMPIKQYAASIRDVESACENCKILNGQPFNARDFAEEMLTSLCGAPNPCCEIVEIVADKPRRVIARRVTA